MKIKVLESDCLAVGSLLNVIKEYDDEDGVNYCAADKDGDLFTFWFHDGVLAAWVSLDHEKSVAVGEVIV
ncbi:hypothetical protein [Salmonella phage SSBI34]|nr:hypothetical protein [Salmonella phage SSBI34]